MVCVDKSSATLLISLFLSLFLSPCGASSPSLRMNTKQTRVAEGMRELAGPGAHAFGRNQFPWVFRGLEVPRSAHATRDRGHTINTGTWRTPTTIHRATTTSPVLSLPRRGRPSEGPPPPRTCARIITYTCVHLSQPTPRVFHRMLADLSLKAMQRPNEKKLPMGIVTG